MEFCVLNFCKKLGYWAISVKLLTQSEITDCICLVLLTVVLMVAATLSCNSADDWYYLESGVMMLCSIYVYVCMSLCMYVCIIYIIYMHTCMYVYIFFIGFFVPEGLMKGKWPETEWMCDLALFWFRVIEGSTECKCIEMLYYYGEPLKQEYSSSCVAELFSASSLRKPSTLCVRTQRSCLYMFACECMYIYI